MATRKRTGLVQVKLRIPADLKRRLDREAKQRPDGSLSAEIAERLEQSFTAPVQAKATAAAIMEEMRTHGLIVSTGNNKKGG
jgi:hypothetical protein